MNVNPYLFFSGNCTEAFAWYHEVLGGELQVIRTADLPDGAEPMPGAQPHHVMHASITLGNGVLMGSDDPTGDGGPKVGVAVAYEADHPKEAQKVFEALSDGGQVMMPFEPTFWSRGFGACTDRFGVQWMVDTAAEP